MNCLILYGYDDDPAAWMPARRIADGNFTDPLGNRIMPPQKWKSATLEEIDAYLMENNLEMLVDGKRGN